MQNMSHRCSGDVERALCRKQEVATFRIQTRWRGYRVRAGLHQRKTRVVNIRAAVKIKRAVSRRLARCKLVISDSLQL